ncbi:MAG TPA: hypothetical protein VFD36_25115 [Kofleriaceae bacterium]|nr:hypothetical protein [Kofleriaceae bacterium]
MYVPVPGQLAVRLAACLAAFASSCQKSAPSVELHCFQSDTSNRPEGGNPLIGTFVGCFDDAHACEARAKAEATQCRATLPRWHCYTVPSRRPADDPLDGLTFCYPSLELCGAARAPNPMFVDDEAPPRRSCKPVETVYCQANGALLCADSEQMCNLAADMVAQTLFHGEPHAACAARHSVGY